MKRSRTLEEALDLNSEILALSTMLRTWPRCDGKAGGCGRLATYLEDAHGFAPHCDACVARQRELFAKNPNLLTGVWKEMSGANRVRRLEALLTGES